MEEYIYRRVTELQTPAGIYYVTAVEDERKIPFSVRKDPDVFPYKVYRSDVEGIHNQEIDDVIAELTTETHYTLVLELSDLEIGKCYKVCFSAGHMEFRGSDEHTQALAVTANGWSAGIGSFDMNEMEKLDQAIAWTEKTYPPLTKLIYHPPCYDETKFEGYDVEASKDSTGYTIKVLDRSRSRIYFGIAWIENGILPSEEYEWALGFWLT